ncbi:MAG: DNA repair protein RecO [Polyangia bacterium]|jgi:DNA repair protein RecO (recombination protein O)|nr:DNA repair protein RecO [Polyangia bacterium]
MDDLRTRALLIRQVDTGESDRVVTLLTEEQGKVAALARGARKSRKRFGAALALFVLGMAELEPRRRSGLPLLKSYDAIAVHAGIAKDLGAIAHGSYATEVIGELCPAGHPEPPLFALLMEMYEYLDQGRPRSLVLRAFELRALEAAGHGPQMGACVRCGCAEGREIAGLGFDPSRGGLLCQGCCRPSEVISTDAVRIMRGLGTGPLGQLGEDPAVEVAAELRKALTGCVMEVVGRPLRTVEFIRKMS